MLNFLRPLLILMAVVTAGMPAAQARMSYDQQGSGRLQVPTGRSGKFKLFPVVTAPGVGNFVSFGQLSNAKARSSVHPNIGAQSFVLDATFSTPSAFTSETQIIGVWGDNFYGQNEWLLSILGNGKPQLAWTDGSNFTILQPTNGLPTSSAVTLRVRANTAAGSAEFFTVDGNGAESSLGLASGGSARSVRFDATNGMVQIGQSTSEQSLYTGNFYAASLRIAGALALNPVAANGAISDSTGALWPITAADPTQLWNTAPNWPTEAPPTGPVTLAAGLTMAAGSTNVSTYDYRSDIGNIKTRAKLNATHYLHSMFGNINQVTGLPMDGLDQSYARYRNYAETNPFNLHTLSPKGVTLGVVSKGNSGTAGPGDWYAGLLRYQENFLPGMTLEWIGTGTVHDLGWMPGWLEQGYQASPGRVPGSNGDPFASGLLQAYIRTDNGANASDDPYYEYDGPDNYSVSFRGAGWEMGKVLTSKLIRRGTDDDPVTMVVPPYTDYVANSGSFAATPGIADVRLTDGTKYNDGQMHVYTMNWLPNGTMEYFFDGKLYLRQHQEFRTQTFVDPIDGQTKQLGMHWMQGGQGIPRFGLGAAGANVTIADRTQLGVTIQSVRMHKGNLDRSSIVELANGVSQTFSPLTLSAPTVSASNFTTQVSGRAEESWVVATTANGQTVVLKNRPPQPPDVNGVAQPRPPTPLVFTFTGTSAAALPITLREYPWSPQDTGYGLPRTTVISSF